MEKVVKTINDLCSKITDGAHNSPVECFEGLYKMYSSKDMTYNSFDDSDAKLISLEDYQKLVNQDCQPLRNDILIIKDGANYLKYVFKVPETIEAVILSSIAILRPNLKVINPDYFVYLLRTASIRNAMSNYVSGAAIPRIVLKDFKKMKMDIVANMSVQKSVSSFLLSYDNLIEVNNKRIKALEQMAENLYKEWFVRFRFPGHENAEFENGIPKEWIIQRMEKYCKVTDGTHDTPLQTENGVPLITGKCIKDGFIDFSIAYLISEKDHEKIKKRSGLNSGDILFSNIGTVGTTCLVNYYREFSVKNVIIFKPNSYIKSLYLYYCLTSKPMQELFATQTNGASQQFVGLNFMRKFKILLPTEEILFHFYQLVQPLQDERNKLHFINKNLIKQRDLLLPRLMSGKLEV